MKKLLFLLFSSITVPLFSQQIELGVNTGQTEEVYQVILTPDEKQLITLGQSTISIWDVKSGKLIRNIVNEGGAISAHITSNGKTLFVVPAYQTIRSFDLSTGKEVNAVKGSKIYFQSTESKDGKYVALLSDSTVDVANPNDGKILYSFVPHAGFITNCWFNLTQHKLYFTSTDSSLFICDLETGKQISRTKNTGRIWRMCVSEDESKIALAERSTLISIWSADGTKKINQFDGKSNPWVIRFIDHDQRIVAYCKDSTIRVWNCQTGVLENSLKCTRILAFHISNDQTKALISDIGAYIKIVSLPSLTIGDSLLCHPGYVKEAVFNADGSKIISYGQDKSAVIWDAKTLKPMMSSNPAQINIAKAVFTQDHKSILLADENDTYTLWDKEKGLRNSTSKIALDSGLVDLFRLYSPKQGYNGKLVINNDGNRIKLMDPATFTEVMILDGHKAYITYAEYNLTGDQIVSCSEDSTIIVWDVATGKQLFTIHNNASFRDARFSYDATKIISGDDKNKGIIWDAKTGKKIFELSGHTAFIEKVCFNHNGTQAATQSSDGTIRVWNASNGGFLYSIKYERILEAAFEFSPNDNWLITQTAYNVIALFDAYNGNKLHELSSHKSVVTSFHFSQDSKQVLTNSWDRTCKLWNPETGKEILTFMNLPDNEWLVLHSSGLFDASSKAMEKLYWVQGLDIIDFAQLKDRFYEPGLWPKIIGGENLREVKGFNEKIPLYPDIRLNPIDSKGDMKIELANRGGGIGKVKLYINGKEVSDDIRNEKFNPDAAAATIVQNLKDHPFLIKGDTNLIEVKAYNKDNWVLSRAEDILYIDKRSKQESTPELFVISIGVSDYQGKDIDLKFPSKDASDMLTSIEVGGKRLFGFEKTHGYLLNSTTETKPTKENIKKIFEEVSSKANTNDVLVVYLSGHGINWGGDEGDWYYLTQDAFSASAESYNDEAIRTKSGVSSKELSDWIRKIPALKQVMIIDACASGRIVEDLVAQRDIPANTIRSLDRMKDRTGLHIITGCAADAVSFEASRYGQGVLTYSLLEGMKGISLREGKFLDIITWFQYARERVPALASGIGGIQEPQIISPNGSESFDVGQMEEEDKKLIPLSTVKPMYVRSNFQDEDDLDDVLALGDKMDEALNEFSSKGAESTIVFVDVKEFPDAYKLIGRYKRENNQITLTLKVKQGTEVVITVTIIGTNADDVVNQLLKKINDF